MHVNVLIENAEDAWAHWIGVKWAWMSCCVEEDKWKLFEDYAEPNLAQNDGAIDTNSRQNMTSKWVAMVCKYNDELDKASRELVEDLEGLKAPAPASPAAIPTYPKGPRGKRPNSNGGNAAAAAGVVPVQCGDKHIKKFHGFFPSEIINDTNANETAEYDEDSLPSISPPPSPTL